MNTTTSPETRALAEVQPPMDVAVMASPGNTALMLNPDHLKNMMALAEIMARGVATVPRHLQKNPGDCLAVVMQATQWGMTPFVVAQKTHLVNGTLGYEAQLVNAIVNTMAPTKDRINYEWFGDWSKVLGKFEERESKTKKDEDTGKPLKYRVPGWSIKDEDGLGIKVWATMKGENTPRVLELLLMQARTRNSPLWAEDPRQQIAYLAVKRWVRLHCPDVLMGVYTPDELAEAPPANKHMGTIDELVKVDLLIADALLTKTDEAALQFWRDKSKLLEKQPQDYERLKSAIADHRRKMREARTVDAAPPPPAEAPPPAPAPAAAEAVTFAKVMDMLVKATNIDALAVAADWIGEVPDPAHRTELTAKFNELNTKMGGGA